MKAAVISMGSISSKMIAEAMQKHFDEVDQLDIKEFEVNLGQAGGVLYAGQPLKKYDCVYARGSGRYANLLRAIAVMISEGTYVPIKSTSYTRAHDKLLTHILLNKSGISQPQTFIASTSQAAKKIIKKLPSPIVLKLPSGTHGKGVMLADSHESAASMIDALAVLKQPFLVQEYIDTDGTDTRAFVVGNNVVAAMKRTAVTGEKRSNIHAGGKAENTVLDEKTKRVAINAAKAMNAEICGVDLLESPRGAKVIEVNISPGIQGITKATGVNVQDKIAKYLFDKTVEFKQKRAGEMKKEAPAQSQDLKELITSADFRGARILLPEIATKLSKLTEDDEVLIRAGKGKIEVERIRTKEKERKEEEE